MEKKKIELSDFTHVMEFPVHWGEMDAAQHVNNLVYLKWSETARIDYFTKIGINTEFSTEGIGPILGWQDCKYIFPIRYPDSILIGTRTHELKDDRFVLQCVVFSKSKNRLASISHHDVIPYDYGQLKKVPLPEYWREGIEKFDGGHS